MSPPLLCCQLLYVFAEGALKPSDLCYLFHLCNGTNGSSLPHLSQLPATLSDVMLGSHLSAAAADVERLVPNVERKKETFLKGRRRSSGGKEKKDNNTIIFLHLSDIHLDRQYSEVGADTFYNLPVISR